MVMPCCPLCYAKYMVNGEIDTEKLYAAIDSRVEEAITRHEKDFIGGCAINTCRCICHEVGKNVLH